jgi:hypothetical protein
MAKGRIVTNEQQQELNGVFFNSTTFFHFVQDINDNWFLFLSDEDELSISGTQYEYLLQIPLSEFVPKPTPPIP